MSTLVAEKRDVVVVVVCVRQLLIDERGCAAFWI